MYVKPKKPVQHKFEMNRDKLLSALLAGEKADKVLKKALKLFHDDKLNVVDFEYVRSICLHNMMKGR